MLAQNYAEWCQLSGLYVANVSHVDRYRTYAQVLSPAGLAVAVVSEFLADANPALDVNDWRSYRVYEFGPQQAERVEQTVSALKAIGAEGLAQAVAASQNQSPMAALQGFLTGGLPGAASLKNLGNPFDMLQALQSSLLGTGRGPSEPDSSPDVAPPQENRQQVEELLEQFAQAHASELQNDIEQYGDPRRVPGFTLARRQQELEVLRVRWISQQTQADARESLTTVMSQIPKLLEQKSAGKEKKAAMHLRQLVRTYQENAKELRRVAVADRSAETTAFLPRLAAFESEHAALLRPDVFGNAQNRQAAEAFGAFEVKSQRKSTTLTWDRPDRLNCDWVQFELTLSVPAKSEAALQAGLNAVEQLRQRFDELQADWKEQVLRSFRDIYQGQMDEEELADYELDEQGEPTEAAILKHVSSGSIGLSTSDPAAREFSLSAFLNVEWDEEHGLELECDVDLGTTATESTSTGFDRCGVEFHDAGPAVTPQQLDQFESTFGLTLPAPYREFLLQTNGGVPSKTRLTLSMDGAEDCWDVTRFLSISGATAEPWPDGSVEHALRPHHGLKIQSCLLPIASVRQGTFPPRRISDTTLALVLTGKRAGRVILWDPEMMLPQSEEVMSEAEQAAVLQETARSAWVAAPNLSALFRKLQTPPVIEIPDWLRAIRENQVDAFLSWLNSGGKLKTPYVEPGSQFQPTVVDLLAAEARPEFLTALIQKQKLTPRQLREAWQRYLFLDVQRFRELMQVLPPTDWHLAFASPFVWDAPDLLDQLAAAQVNVNAALNDDDATALHRAVQMGRLEAVRWLMAHGADPRQKDHYGNDAFTYAEHDPGRECRLLLEGRSEPVITSSPVVDPPEVAELEHAAGQLASGVTLQIQIEITSPPVTRVEQLYYGELGCHYCLTFDIGNGQVTFKDLRSPRQDYLRAKTWTEARFLPILQWPELVPRWETLQVCEYELAKALKSRKYTPAPRPDLLAAAESTLKQSFDAGEAAARRGKTS